MILSAALSSLGAEPAASAPPPRVRLHAPRAEQASAPPLFDWLVVRLLEEGYAVAGSDEAEIDLTIAPEPTLGWTVRAEGESAEDFSVAAGEDPAVARLELLHRAVHALESVEPRERPADAKANAFAIEFAAAFSPDERTRIEPQIALAVLASGGSLSPARGSSDFVVCAGQGHQGVRIDLAAANAPCPEVLGTDPNVLSPTRMRTSELVVAALSLGEEREEKPLPVQARERERPPPKRESEPMLGRRPIWSDSALVLRGGLAAGIVGRPATIDPLIATSMFIGREPGLSAWIDLQLIPTIAPIGFRYLEVIPSAGMRLRLFTRGIFSMDIGGLLGLKIHSWRVRTVFNEISTGTEYDISSEGAAGFAVRMGNQHEFFVLARAGGGGRSRAHLSEGAILWQRSPIRFGITVGFTFGRQVGP